ncbi:MAG: hypothetical protein R2711_12850 [Acidimicrobiales bacterium]
MLCDTNGGSLPHEVESIVREVTGHFRDDCKVAVHLHDDTGCGVANALAGVRAAGPCRCRGPSTATAAHRQLQPHHHHPEPHPEDGRAHAARRAPQPAHLGQQPHRRDRQLHARPPGPLRGLLAFATRPGCTCRPSAAARTPTSTSTPTWWATAPASW